MVRPAGAAKHGSLKWFRYLTLISLSIVVTAFVCDRLLFFLAPWLPIETARCLSAGAKLRRVVKAQDAGTWIFDGGIR